MKLTAEIRREFYFIITFSYYFQKFLLNYGGKNNRVN